MDDDLHKICMFCSSVYEGNPLTYNLSTVSHGVCNKLACHVESVSYSFQCDKVGALEILKELGGLEKLTK